MPYLVVSGARGWGYKEIMARMVTDMADSVRRPLQKPADPFSGPSMAPFSVTLRGPAAPAAKFPFFALPPQVKVAVSMAVRKPKEHEEEGIHYKFQGKADAFKKMIEKGEIIADTKVS